MSTVPVDRVRTSVGPADVLHRLALGVECLDAVTGLRLRAEVRAGRELDPRLLAAGSDPGWPCRSLERKGTARFQLLLDDAAPSSLVLRLVDPARRVVARRLELPLWTLDEVRGAERTPPTVPTTSRIVRPWLWPGAAADLPRGATVVRGRVETAGRPVPWARVTAVSPGDGPVGYAHADDRGEFVLLLTGTGMLPPPPPSSLTVRLEVLARPLPAEVPDADPETDPLDGLVAESLARPSNPPAPAELDNPTLRGRAAPPGHLPSTATAPEVDVPLGAELVLAAPIPFAA